MIKELLRVIKAQQEYIDAIPDETAASFPAMPGFDRDWADEIIYKAEQAVKEE
ncbi:MULTISPECIES: hypothetical protein [Pseudoalteromonas]|uniref:hypothetical protein n=1 Tax=Pseudoalteromonas TaxID=53246 RepID=UPI001582F745|nr:MULTISPECIES: hypothetical protein [Pseudoalteromonas]MDI4654251.1 hypothetical protein [Pseudoalteromonas shioyasakiensis]NUJ40205.1 hypothetical protein [Pseudoalteromonas sp. 0303]